MISCSEIIRLSFLSTFFVFDFLLAFVCFLFLIFSEDDEEEALAFFFGASEEDEDEALDFLGIFLGASSDEEERALDFFFGASEEEEECALAFFFGASEEEEDSFLFFEEVFFFIGAELELDLEFFSDSELDSLLLALALCFC